MVTSNVASASSAVNGQAHGSVNPSSLLTISQASSFAACHAQTLRNHVRAGRLQAYRMGPHGWLRFNQDELAKLFGIRIKKEEVTRKVAILARVSSDGQKDYLKSQVKRLRDHVKKEYGENNPLVFEEVCSAFGDRKALYACVDAIIDGRVDVLVVEYRDRLSRTSALTNMIKHLCKRYGVQIVYVQKSENDPKSINASLEELVEFTTHISAKQNGMKSASRNKIDVSTDCMRRAYELKCRGLSERQIAEELEKEGFVHAKTGKPYKRTTIGLRLRNNWTVLTKMYNGHGGTTSFEKFARTHLTNTKGKSKLTRKRIVEAYGQWCRDNGELETSNSHITKVIDRTYEVKKEVGRDRSVTYLGLSLTMRTKELV